LHATLGTRQERLREEEEAREKELQRVQEDEDARKKRLDDERRRKEELAAEEEAKRQRAMARKELQRMMEEEDAQKLHDLLNKRLQDADARLTEEEEARLVEFRRKNEEDRRREEERRKKLAEMEEYQSAKNLTGEQKMKKAEENKKRLEQEKKQKLEEEKMERQKRTEEVKRRREEEEKKLETTPPLPRNSAKYKATADDAIDVMLADFLQTTHHEELKTLKRVSTGNYSFGTTKVQLKLVNNNLVARVGGGWMNLDDFMKKSYRKSGVLTPIGKYANASPASPSEKGRSQSFSNHNRTSTPALSGVQLAQPRSKTFVRAFSVTGAQRLQKDYIENSEYEIKNDHTESGSDGVDSSSEFQ